jgi:hypothetical protein
VLVVLDQHLQRPGDRADERPGQGRRGDLVQLAGVRRGQVPRDLALRVELELQPAPAHRRHGVDEVHPQRRQLAGQVVAVVADPA